ncbi:MAG: hypothetical protein M3O98_11175 [Actinomycetota bacterium]|nr:hypothetical protein [Actinomycetota bacterium]
MRVRLRNPDRDVDVTAGRTVRELVTREARMNDADELEIRPVISGGADGRDVRPAVFGR